jgi:fatty acid synthase subunit alpha
MREQGLEAPYDLANTQQATQAQTQVVADPAAIKHFEQFGQDLAHLVSKHFGPTSKLSEQKVQEAAQGKSDTTTHSEEMLSQELGSDFLEGIKPIFSSRQVFTYKSSWNWVVQDLYVVLSRILTDSTMESKDFESWIDAQAARLQCRYTPRMRECIRYLEELWRKKPESVQRDRCLRLFDRVLTTPEGRIVPDTSGRLVPKTTISENGTIRYEEVPSPTDRPVLVSFTTPGSSQMSSGNQTPSSQNESSDCYEPHICTQTPAGAWRTDLDLTAELHRAEINTSETQHSIGTVMIIGAGQRSIGFILVEQLLSAGRRVILTTSRITRSLRKVYSDMYAKYAQPGAELVLLPFNQGSVQDISNVVDYVHVELGWEIDHLIPFAALSEIGRTIENIDPTSELAHRIMLTNTLRLIGTIISSKRQRGILHHCTQVLLPLSPNHGQLGGDGMYAESKLGLEALMNKWHAEGWSDSASICSVRIGWTRGTGLMSANDILAEGMEKLGVRTFSAKEMATLLSFAMSSRLYEAASRQPLLCDFSGDMMSIPNLRDSMHSIRESIDAVASLRRRLHAEAQQDTPTPKIMPAQDSVMAREPRARLRREIPVLPKHHHEAVADIGYDLHGLIDLDSTVVITGFAELGAAGSSRTRWELESTGAFSLEGCIELAWMTGLIKYERNRLHEGKAIGAGWIDANSGAPIKDLEIKERYEKHIIEHTGIRILDPDPWQSSTDPRLKDMLQEVGTQGDLPPFECTHQAAQDLKTRHGSALEIISDSGDMATVRVLNGATIFVPKSLGTDFFVGAQVPTSWDAAKYGIPPEVIAQVTRPVLFSLVCVAEAFLSAGVEDVYDFYRYIHVSEVGNCMGSGSGGVASLHAVFERRFLGKDVQNDILSESFVGIVGAWINLLLLSAAGPLRSPAGTCATSLESLDTACDLIGLGKVKMCLTGGFDSATRPIFHEFAEMGATINSAQDIEGGREPSEMSRPFTKTRNGFVLGDGCGVQVVTSASLALQMGLPIYGVVAMTHMAADKLGRSVPAPGKGVLTAAKQSSCGPPPAMLNPVLRAKRIQTSLQHIERQAETDIAFLQDEDAYKASRQEPTFAETLEVEVALIRENAKREKKAVARELGNNFWKNDPRISPIIGSLAVFGLTIDDLTFASLHGTSTKLNDINECKTLDAQMCHLGRRTGNPLFTIAQKSVCGHGLGASGAWAINGGLQAMHSGIVPGNRNADDIDAKLSKYEALLLTNTNILLEQSQMKAFSVTSFGFGQKGGQVIVVHPRYLFAAISDDQYQEYQEKQSRRAQIATRALDRGLHGEGMFKAKEHTPYLEQEVEALLDPLWRMS